MKPRTLLYVSAGLFVVFILASPCRAEKVPDWVKTMGNADAYPAGAYLVGFGESAAGETGGERLESAKGAARADIAMQVRVNVTAMTRSNTQDKSGKVDSFSQTMSKSTANIRLDGIRIAETWCTKKGDRCCALAVLDKAETTKALRSEIRSLDAEAAGLCAKADAETGQAPGRAVEDLMTAKGKLNLARGQTGVLLGLGGGAADLAPTVNAAEIDRKIQTLLAGSGKDMDLAVTLMAYEIARAVDPRLRIMVDQFTMEPGKFSGSLAWFLSEGAQDRLVFPCGMNVVDRNQLTGKAAAAAGYRGMDPAAPEARARVVDADAVLYGGYRVMGDKVYITATLTDLAKGARLASAKIEVDRSALDAKGLTLAPKNVTKDLLEPPKVESPELNVRLWTDRGDGGVYKAGELMYVYMQANHDCYVRLIYTQADGTNVQIFPNAYDQDNKIKKDKVYLIPNKDDSFDFEIGPPFGAEVLQAFASTAPFPALSGRKTDDGMLVLDGAREGIVEKTRGVRLKKRDALYTESKCVLSTLPAGK